MVPVELSCEAAGCDWVGLSQIGRDSDNSLNGVLDDVFRPSNSPMRSISMLKKITLALSVIAIALFASFTPQLQADPGGGACKIRSGGCTVTNLAFTPDSNPTPPFPVCNVGLYRMNATITCGVGFGDAVSGYVCPNTGQAVIIQLNGQTHTFAPKSGYNWSDVFNDCELLTYSVS
jgi:hypothetical protein